MSNPQLIGPFNSTSNPPLTTGTAFEFSIDPSAIAIQVHNDTPYRCYVAFDGARPTASIAATGTYQGIAGPWGHPVIMVRGQYSSFMGNVWIMPIDVSAPLAQTGSVSQLAEIHIDVFMPGDSLPQSWSMPRQQDITSQPRTVIVPTGVAHFYQGIWSGVGTQDIVTFTGNAAQQAALILPVYLYYANIIPEPHTGDTYFLVQVQWKTIAGVNVGSPFVFARGIVFCNTTTFTAVPWILAPTFPLAIVGPQAATTAKATLQLANVGGTPISVAYNFAFSMDFTNISGTAEIGQTPFNGTSQPLF